MRDTPAMADIASRLADLDWARSNARCGSGGTRRRRPCSRRTSAPGLIAMYEDDARFRSRVDMARYRFGVGEYKYFAAAAAAARAGAPHARVSAAGGHRQPVRGGAGDRDAASDRPGRACWRAVTGAGRRSPRRCCCTTRPAATTVCTRTSTATWCSRCSSRASSAGGRWTTRAATSCWSSSGPARSRAAKRSPPSRARS